MEVAQIKLLIRNIFDPLASRLGLDGPIELTLTPSDVHLGYTNLGKEIGLEITVEVIDFFIYALIFRPSGDGLPVGYSDENGKRQKLYIQQALKELSIDISQETRELQTLAGDYRNCQILAEKLAGLVEHYWSDISQHPSRWFK